MADLTATNDEPLLLALLEDGVMRPINSYLASVMTSYGQLQSHFYLGLSHTIGAQEFTGLSSNYAWQLSHFRISPSEKPMFQLKFLECRHANCTCGTVRSVSSPESLITLSSIEAPDCLMQPLWLPEKSEKSMMRMIKNMTWSRFEEVKQTMIVIWHKFACYVY